MAFPSAGTPVATSFDTSVTSMAVNMPATVTSGDLLIALVEVRNAGTWTKPTGWSDISTVSQAGGGSVGKLNGFYKIADGTEGGGTATWTASTGTSAIWQVIRVTSWHGTTAPEGATASGDATNANPPSLTPSWGAADDLWIAVAANAATGETTGFTAAPTNYTGLQSNGASTGGATCNVATATRQLNATSEDPGTFTPSSNRFWAAATIAVRPAASSNPAIAVTDTSTPSDTALLSVGNYISSLDSSAPTDTATLQVASYITPTDSTAPTDSALLSVRNNIAVTDSSTPIDSVVIRTSIFQTVLDTTTPSDSATLSIANYASITDTTTPTDSVVLEVGNTISVSDGVGVSDTVALSVGIFISVLDSTTVTDLLPLRYYDEIQVGDSVKIQIGGGAYLINVTDSTTPTDSITMTVTGGIRRHLLPLLGVG